MRCYSLLFGLESFKRLSASILLLPVVGTAFCYCSNLQFGDLFPRATASARNNKNPQNFSHFGMSPKKARFCVRCCLEINCDSSNNSVGPFSAALSRYCTSKGQHFTGMKRETERRGGTMLEEGEGRGKAAASNRIKRVRPSTTKEAGRPLWAFPPFLFMLVRRQSITKIWRAWQQDFLFSSSFFFPFHSLRAQKNSHEGSGEDSQGIGKKGHLGHTRERLDTSVYAPKSHLEAAIDLGRSLYV